MSSKVLIGVLATQAEAIGMSRWFRLRSKANQTTKNANDVVSSNNESDTPKPTIYRKISRENAYGSATFDAWSLGNTNAADLVGLVGSMVVSEEVSTDGLILEIELEQKVDYGKYLRFREGKIQHMDDVKRTIQNNLEAAVGRLDCRAKYQDSGFSGYWYSLPNNSMCDWSDHFETMKDYRCYESICIFLFTFSVFCNGCRYLCNHRGIDVVAIVIVFMLLFNLSLMAS